MPAIIVETCFNYREKGPGKIGKLIVEGIAAKEVSTNYIGQNSNNEKYAIVTASVLNVRGGAETNYPVIGQVKRGDKIKLDCKVGDWWSTYYGEHGGFMYGEYLK